MLDTSARRQCFIVCVLVIAFVEHWFECIFNRVLDRFNDWCVDLFLRNFQEGEEL